MKRDRNCQARQHSDQMICSKCGLVWDVNDPEPPECGTGKPTPLTAEDFHPVPPLGVFAYGDDDYGLVWSDGVRRERVRK